MRWVLSLIILLCGIGAGWMKALPYENRVLHLRDLEALLRALEAEMAYRREPLPELFERLGASSQNLAEELLSRTGARLKLPYSHDFCQVWESGVEEIYGSSSLKEEDRRVLLELGRELGKTDLGNQAELFKEAGRRLAQGEQEALEEKRARGRMYKGLGAAAGAATVILLL